ncbi:MAG TPA: hypothetical protein VFS09_11230 [Candidatus Eisenbacteria bacterium]|nr:hypothetical protein [Candidatus Eisenbacteria bacterium]
MRDSMRHYAAATVLAVLFAAIGTPLSAFNDPDAEGESQRLAKVTYYDDSAWLTMVLAAGSFEGPAGGASPTARIKSEMGGPKTYFILAGAGSELKIGNARPRFRFSADQATAQRVQLALFEVKDEVRRTPIEIGKGGTMFNRGVELEVTKVRDGVFEARPKKSLQPGEYALVTSEADPAADFTIVARGY